MYVGKSYNKLFKSDSQRVAFLLCVVLSVLGGMRRHRYCVAHTLTGRYKVLDYVENCHRVPKEY
ncbi:TPA: DUF3265 domain-containing protein [Vibrio parahaemolyticus]|nr:DUF3265 domain-containing protein [Vibrio parahaemolyticus]MBE5186839.1 DUF3265 domain-containing protein [Vibrio parahaemolyticus]MBE5200610.1 DUF3265 domain-containing protein [Vibrio parahaemolyticus]HCE1551879.1 DUF3265 domain-containing protein [Vibrio parahaemolyticus]HCE3205281.1 DUF3265 domain-containing protein [Vibrio parahaemolyticus]